jgi:hypothetical protein
MDVEGAYNVCFFCICPHLSPLVSLMDLVHNEKHVNEQLVGSKGRYRIEMYTDILACIMSYLQTVFLPDPNQCKVVSSSNLVHRL